MGTGAGLANKTGNDNIYIGQLAGHANGGTNNVFLGRSAGQFSSLGSANVFIGHEAGYNETGSNKLYIDNTNTTTPLLYGEFDNDLLRINGTLNVNETIQLAEKAAARFVTPS